MNELQILVVDDEKVAREGICLLLSSLPGVRVIGEASQGEDAVASILKLRPDIVFLDVQMPFMNGFEVLRALPTESVPIVIFVTAYDHHALEAFEVNAVDYLLKPFTDERFFKAFDRAKFRFDKTTAAGEREKIAPLLQYLQSQSISPTYLKRLMVKDGSRIIFLQTEEIVWIEAADYYVILHLAEKSHLIRETMSSMDEKLDPSQFARIHRSSIVNMDWIKELQPYGKEDYMVILRNGKSLRMGRAWLKKLAGKLGKYT